MTTQRVDDHAPAEDAESPLARRFTRRIYATRQQRDPAWGALKRWRPGRVDAYVLEATFDGNDDEWPYLAVAGAAMAAHGDTSNGYNGLAGELRRCKDRSGGYGPNNTAATAALRMLLAADTIDAFHQAVVRAARVLDQHGRRPHWGYVVDELLAWANPETRDTQRTAWGRDFYTYKPAHAGQ